MTHRHHHGYMFTQYRHRSWFTRVCLHPSCGVVALTWQARVLLLLLGVALGVILPVLV